jgi:hypothetical protein
MTKDKPCLNRIGKIYKQQTIDNLMYGYVTGVQDALPNITTLKAIEQFMKTFNLSEDEFSRDVAAVKMSTWKKEFLKNY